MIALNQLSRVGIGTSRAASLGSRLSLRAFTAFLDTATEQGVNLLDTSSFYGSGDAERLIARGLKVTGHPFFVVTKAGLPYVHAPGWLSPLNQIAKKMKQRAGAIGNFTPAYLLRSTALSNQRLGVETADALLLHEPSWDDLTGDDPWEGLAKIRQQGLARYTGVSTNDYRVVAAGISSGQVQLVQTAVAWRSNSAIAALCRTHRIPVIANLALQPYRTLQPQFARQATAIQHMSGLADISLVQLLIAAVLAENQANTVLFGTSNLAHLVHNIGALRYVSSLPPALPTLNRLLK